MRIRGSGTALRRVAVVLTAGAVAATALLAASGAAATVLIARTVVTPPRARRDDIRLLAFDPGVGTITLEATPDSIVDGEYSFWFDRDSGHARLGEILGRDEGSVTRRLLGVDFGELALAQRGRIAGWVHLSPRSLGVPYENVAVETDLGPAPAWLVPAEGAGEDWVIQVHGRAVRRSEGLRAVPVFRAAGYTSLLISYRNDSEAPASTDGRYALGGTEWLDVEAAMRFALDRGARRIVLMGWSMGGAIVLQAVTRSELASVISGVVLESPVVDWITALHYQGVGKRFPGWLRGAVLAVLGADWGRRLSGHAEPIDFARLDFVTRAAELDVPILLIHSDDDGFVPATASRALAQSRPDIVTFESFETARHTKIWNFDPERWTSAISSWLAALPDASARTVRSSRRPEAG